VWPAHRTVAYSLRVATWTQRYLTLLGLEPAPAPTLQTLERIARAHLERVPFESITSVLRRRASNTETVPPLDPDQILTNWEHRRSGGLCFEVTEMVSRLLTEVGYQAHPVLGRISFPGSHQAVHVILEKKQHLVDLGNGAPFFDPIPLDEPFEIRRAGLAYRFRPENGQSVQDRWIDNAWQPFCRYDLNPPDPVEREQAYQQHHVIGCSWVVDSLVLVRCTPDAVWSLRDGQFSHFTVDGKQVAQLENPEADYPRLARDLFGLPNLPVTAALHALCRP
jgi:arylamine N-acetyltransferase